MHSNPFFQFRERALSLEKEHLFSKASFSYQHKRKDLEELDHRLPYKRDVDRIIHSKAYARYVDKTQVVYLVKNDHITHRALHVQLVSNFARGVAEILRLNLDLVEAIALGHDVGHPPFGHEGERYLSLLSQEFGAGLFTHSWQSCRLFTLIEPLNLGLTVYDGFLCHDGGMQERAFSPRFGKSWEEHAKDLQEKKEHPEKNIMPTTLEGCLVKLADTISYLGRDIEDAITLGILKREEIPHTILGTSNREILSYFARDIIYNSYEKESIALSEEAFESLKALRRFNFEKIYIHPRLKIESSKIKKAYRILFEHLLEDLEKHQEKSYIHERFLHNKSSSYLESTNAVQKVIDYVAGMTDNYFVSTFERLIVPQGIKLCS